MTPLTTEQLEAKLDELRQASKDTGTLDLIVRRPRSNEREILSEGELNLLEGLAGDAILPAAVDEQRLVLDLGSLDCAGFFLRGGRHRRCS